MSQKFMTIHCCLVAFALTMTTIEVSLRSGLVCALVNRYSFLILSPLLLNVEGHDLAVESRWKLYHWKWRKRSGFCRGR